MDSAAPRQLKAMRVTRQVAAWQWTGGLWAGSSLLVAVSMVYVAAHAVAGRLGDLVDPAEPLGLTPETRVGLIMALVSAYTAGCGLAGLGAAARDLDALAPLTRGRGAAWTLLADRLAPSAREMLLAVFVGGTIGVALNNLPPLLSGEWDRTLLESLPSNTLMFLLFALLGIQTLLTMRQSRVFTDAGRDHIRVSLLDPRPLAPFARAGLRSAAMWFGGSALASLLFVQSTTAWIVALVLTVTIGIGISGLLLPSRGLHLRIRVRKREELARVRAAIEGGGEALFAGPPGAADAARLPSLIAYEARIEAVREWPFDTATVRRFLLLLLIPLASWVGGALVERVVDAALG